MTEFTIEDWDYATGTLTDANAPYEGSTDSFSIVSTSVPDSSVGKALEMPSSSFGVEVRSYPADPSLDEYPEPGDTIRVWVNLGSSPGEEFQWAIDSGDGTRYVIAFAGGDVELGYLQTDATVDVLDTATGVSSGWFEVEIVWDSPNIDVTVYDNGGTTVAMLNGSDSRNDSTGGIGFRAAEDGAQFGVTTREPPSGVVIENTAFVPDPDGRTDASPRRGFRVQAEVTVGNNQSQDLTDTVSYALAGETLDSETVTVAPGESRDVTLHGVVTAPPGEHVHSVTTEADTYTEVVTVGETETWGNHATGTLDSVSTPWSGDLASATVVSDSAESGGAYLDLAAGASIHASGADVASFNSLDLFGDEAFMGMGDMVTAEVQVPSLSSVVTIRGAFASTDNHYKFTWDAGNEIALSTMVSGVETTYSSTTVGNHTGRATVQVWIRPGTDSTQYEFGMRVLRDDGSVLGEVSDTTLKSVDSTDYQISVSGDTHNVYSVASGTAHDPTVADEQPMSASAEASEEIPYYGRDIETFRDPDLSRYTGDTGLFRTQSTETNTGANALEKTPDSSFGNVFTTDTSYLPRAGDRFRFSIRADASVSQYTYFGVQDSLNWYAIETSMAVQEIRLLKCRDGFVSELGSDDFAARSGDVSAWLGINVDWTDVGEFEVYGTDINGVEARFEAVDPTPHAYESGGIGFGSDQNGGSMYWDSFIGLSRAHPTTPAANSTGVTADARIVNERDGERTTAEIDAVLNTDQSEWILADDAGTWDSGTTQFPDSPDPYQVVTDSVAYTGQYSIYNKPTIEETGGAGLDEAVSFEGGYSDYWDINHDPLPNYPSPGDTFAFYVKAPRDYSNQSEYDHADLYDNSELDMQFHFAVQDYYRTPEGDPWSWSYAVRTEWFGTETYNGRHFTELVAYRELNGQRVVLTLAEQWVPDEAIQRDEWYRIEVDWGQDYALTVEIIEAETGDVVARFGGVDPDDGQFTRFTGGGISIESYVSHAYVDRIGLEADSNRARTQDAQAGSSGVAATLYYDQNAVIGRTADAESSSVSADTLTAVSSDAGVATAEATGVEMTIASEGRIEEAQPAQSTASPVSATLSVTDYERAKFGAFQFGDLKFGEERIIVRVVDDASVASASASGVTATVEGRVSETGTAEAASAPRAATEMMVGRLTLTPTSAAASGVQAVALRKGDIIGSVATATASPETAQLAFSVIVSGERASASITGVQADLIEVSELPEPPISGDVEIITINGDIL